MRSARLGGASKKASTLMFEAVLLARVAAAKRDLETAVEANAAAAAESAATCGRRGQGADRLARLERRRAQPTRVQPAASTTLELEPGADTVARVLEGTSCAERPCMVIMWGGIGCGKSRQAPLALKEVGLQKSDCVDVNVDSLLECVPGYLVLKGDASLDEEALQKLEKPPRLRVTASPKQNCVAHYVCNVQPYSYAGEPCIVYGFSGCQRVVAASKRDSKL